MRLDIQFPENLKGANSVYNARSTGNSYDKSLSFHSSSTAKRFVNRQNVRVCFQYSSSTLVEGDCPMPIEARIRELDARHSRLDAQIDEVKRHPSADSLEVAYLKKEKLRIKEQIESLRRSEHTSMAN